MNLFRTDNIFIHFFPFFFQYKTLPIQYQLELTFIMRPFFCLEKFYRTAIVLIPSSNDRFSLYEEKQRHLFLSSQNATAEAAATFSESTLYDIGMRAT